MNPLDPNTDLEPPVEVDPPPELVDAPTQMEEFALGTEGAIPSVERPPWLDRWPPKKRPFAWPSGAKSPTWFRKIAACALAHAHRYRRRRADPSGLMAMVGLVIHGALEDAANIRMFPGHRTKGIPSHVTPEELLYLLEFQKEAVRQNLDVIASPESYGMVTSEVLARARDTVTQLKPVSLDNLWIDPRSGKGGAEYIWNFHVTEKLMVAGVIDLIQVQPDPRNPNAPPLRVTITDWKTGPGQEPTRGELALDPQACLQLIWAHRIWPNTPTIRFRVVNLSMGFESHVDWTPGLEELTLSFVRACWNLWATQTETANVSPACSYCPYRGDCKDYQQHLRESTFNPPVGALNERTMPELLEDRYEAHTLFKVAESRKQDCDKLIMQGLGTTPSYQYGRLKAKKRSRKNTFLSDEGNLLEKLASMSGTGIPALVDSLCRVDNAKLLDYVMTLPVAQQALARKLVEDHQITRQSKPWIEVNATEAVF